MRVLIGFHEIAGYYEALQDGFEKLGVDCHWVSLIPYAFGSHRRRRRHWILAAWEGCHHRATDPRYPRFRRWPWRITAFFLGLAALVWTMVRCRAVIFGFGRTFFSGWELPMLRLAGVRLVFVYHGSDARPPYLDGPFLHGMQGAIDGVLLARVASQRCRRIRWQERWAHAVICQPETSQFFTRPSIPYLAIGVPCLDLPQPNSAMVPGPPAASDPGNRPVLAIHCPSNPAVKGTPKILESLAALAADGQAIRLEIITNRPNSEVRAAIARADLVIDQIYSDTPMAGLATEAAWLGKACIVCGYADWRPAHLSAQQIPPTLRGRPDELPTLIGRVLEEPGLVVRIGNEARDFVRSQWSTRAVAERFARIISDPNPGNDGFPRVSSNYLLGCGAHRTVIAQAIASILASVGRGGLQLTHRPDLEDLAQHLAGEQDGIQAPSLCSG